MNPEDRQLEEQLMSLAKNTRPNPDFQKQLGEQLHAAQSAGANRKVVAFRPRWSVAAALMIVALVGVLLAAPLQSLAQDLWDSFFNRVSDTEIYDEPIEVPIIGPTPITSAMVSPPRTLDEARADAPFHIKVPGYLPDGFDFIDADFDPGANQSSVFFGNPFDGLNLVQTPLEDAQPFDIGESADVTEVQIGAVTGEFVRGIWMLRSSSDEDTFTVEGREWDGDFPFEQLVWSDGEYRYWLSSVMGQGSSLPLEEWVRVAESLQ
jgi:hypothetical protein